MRRLFGACRVYGELLQFPTYSHLLSHADPRVCDYNICSLYRLASVGCEEKVSRLIWSKEVLAGLDHPGVALVTGGSGDADGATKEKKPQHEVVDDIVAVANPGEGLGGDDRTSMGEYKL